MRYFVKNNLFKPKKLLRYIWKCVFLKCGNNFAKNVESAGHFLKMSSQLVTWIKVEPNCYMLKWLDLKITKLHIKIDGWFVDCVLRWQVLWPRVVMCCDIEFDCHELCWRVLWPCVVIWVLWPRAMLVCFMTACYNVEWVGRVPKMMCQLVTCLNDLI